jgi:hypothetical protein
MRMLQPLYNKDRCLFEQTHPFPVFDDRSFPGSFRKWPRRHDHFMYNLEGSKHNSYVSSGWRKRRPANGMPHTEEEKVQGLRYTHLRIWDKIARLACHVCLSSQNCALQHKLGRHRHAHKGRTCAVEVDDSAGTARRAHFRRHEPVGTTKKKKDQHEERRG